MTPREYEKYVASIFKGRGYEVELTPSSGDYGIDVIAHNDHEKVAMVDPLVKLTEHVSWNCMEQWHMENVQEH